VNGYAAEGLGRSYELRKEAYVTILWIILIVVLVLVLLGFLGFR
jgi:flagellar basal body-associated protein FliL